jgi:hypothetical protein
MKTNKTYLLVIFVYIFALVLAQYAHAGEKCHVYDGKEPVISNFQGSERGTSVIEVVWPDGKVEKLLYKDIDSESDGFVNWFVERCKAYNKRAGNE